ncbi:ectoine/hydroxyectoine ABC transporter permease subunit EhuD [Streptomyces sp. SID8375]|uniref:Ectoine/hydroxyectoine ABC transporter permease subunit EhuD n=2 Tax=Streptomyces nigrescens TaxID=1920 RepID=A0A640TLM3_STRNI|nr:ectoine/hydroxyectoine ABC transporter permease subunit EhuD [Streptomyces sp. NEAU-S7GS2]MYT13237.1 ectoine/hydroxyectoine ABC transporter permease subunit EhuD [Streptomyces sp. SID4951]MYX10536.1 ectoine/hydroxyectoine ABC transporter permease subunit EhuD [Streptomyces sp. SID8375]SCK48667.1 polar amino acid transport system permease protein [Streptomyces sp. SceaMP-e96]GFE24517.1 ectoine/hydroxyectoine ABC transporter permease subunit EhuD [Streptomyces libani subsp. libani]
MNNWSWSYIGEIMPEILKGLWITIQATFYGSLVSFALGLVWAMALRSRSRWVTWPVSVFVEFIRNTPLLVQLFFLFFVLPGWGLTFAPLTTGVIGLGLHYSTYTSEVYRAGIDGVPPGQWEAATALNLPRRRTWTAVILPQAFRRVVPALGNYVIAMFKDTPLLAGITVADMLFQANSISATTFDYLEPITVVGILFVVISYPTSLLLRALERRLVR